MTDNRGHDQQLRRAGREPRRPRAQIARALELLGGGGRRRASSRSRRCARPTRSGYEDQPRFLNGAAELETTRSPPRAARAAARDRARARTRRGDGPRYGPRTIDLDLLLYGDAQIDEPGLEIPHPRLHERRFALEPLAELDPALEIPGRGPVQALLGGLE